MTSPVCITSILEAENLIQRLKTDPAIAHEITSISIAIPADADLYDAHRSEYASLYAEKISGTETDYKERIGNIAHDVYQKNAVARDESIVKAHTLASSIVELSGPRLEHFEHILPAWPEPAHIFGALPGLPNLKSLSIQWRHAAVNPFASLPLASHQDALDNFTQSLAAFCTTHPHLRRLRLSLPQTFLPRHASFTSNVLEQCLANPTMLPELETLDLTHTGPGYDTVLCILDAHPRLLHLILDQGAEFRDPDANAGCIDSDEDEDGEIASPETEPQTLAEKLANLAGGWAGLGAYIATHPSCELRAISAALGDSAVHIFSRRLTSSSLREKLVAGAIAAKECSDTPQVHAEECISKLSICTAWPSSYSEHETKPLDGYEAETNPDVYRHADSCAHLSGFPPNQRPSTNVWPAKSSEELSYRREIY